MKQRVACGGLSHRGHVLARGLLWHADLLEPSERVRVLAPLLLPDDQLLHVGALLFVRFASPRRLQAELSPAHVVVEQHGLLTTFPLTRAEALELAAPVGSLVWLHAGQVSLATPLELTPCKPEAWLELGHVQVLAVDPFVAPPATLELAQHKTVDVRAQLGVAPLSSEAALAHAAAARHAAWLGVGAGLLRSALAWLRGLGDQRSRTASTAAMRSPSATTWLVHATLRGLARLGMLWLWLWPHERYLRKLDALFEKGDTLEALRHALPLGGDGTGQPQRLALAPPGRRGELSLLRGPGAFTSVLPLGDGWLAHLRKLYERAFEQLESAHQIEQAAFVLAELLGDVPRALQWLERHGKVRLAAELADARAAPVAERVRLWFLAEELQRAVDLAVRHAAFAEAVTRLSERDRAAGEALRVLWAEHRARAGNYLEAARIAGSVTLAAPLVARWLEVASEEQGPTAHSAWILRLSREPALLPAARSVLAPLFAAQHHEAPAQRALLAQEVLALPRCAALDALTTPLLRALLRDQGAQVSTLPARVLKDLLARAPVLRADVPPRVGKPAGAARARSLSVLRLLAQDRGSTTVHAVVPLSDGRTLLALGELGIKLLSRTGGTLAHWSREPAYRLVPSRGAHVITLAGRGPITRLGRLNLATRRHARWFDLELTSSADCFDGASWFVTLADATSRLVCLDAADDAPRASWSVELEAPVRGIQVADDSCDVLTVHATDGLELHAYELPGAVLRTRCQLEVGVAFALAGKGRRVTLSDQRPALLSVSQAHNHVLTHELPGSVERFDQPPALAARWPWLWLVQSTVDGQRVEVVNLQSGQHLHSVQLDGATQVRVCFHEGLLAVADELGRIVRIDLECDTHTVLRV